MAAVQVERLRLNGYALGAVVDGLGWRTSPAGHFLLAQWLCNNYDGSNYGKAIDEVALLLGAVAEKRV